LVVKVIKYFILIAIMNLVYIIVFTLHMFNFWSHIYLTFEGVQIRQQGSIYTSRFGPRGSKSTEVQINCNTGMEYSITVVGMINNYCTVDDLDNTWIYIQGLRSMVYDQ
jgi:hypothetical protein